MDRSTALLTVALLAITTLGAAEGMAQTATQVVRFRVTAASQASVSGNPTPLSVNSAPAGSAPTSAVATGTTYAITTNEVNQKITASLDRDMPDGVTLEVQLAAPTGAASVGSVPLGQAGADVVTGISSTAASTLPITYRLTAAPQVRLAPTSRTVTLTIVAGT
jgi:hypothetical protein